MFSSPRINQTIDGRFLFIGVAGESGAGKTTFVDTLIASQPQTFQRPVSVTTRERRNAEGDGEYSFITNAEFDQLNRSELLLNADTVYSNRYGITASSHEAIIAAGKTPIKEMTIENALSLRDRGLFVVIVHLDETYRSSRAPNERRSALGEHIKQKTGSNFAIFRPKLDTPERCARDFHLWLQSCVAFSGNGLSFLLSSGDNDAFNTIGYEDVADEFTDDLRVTTKFFHGLTLPFWLSTVNLRLYQGESFLEIGPGRGWLRSVLDWPESCAYRAVDLSTKMANLNDHSSLIDVASSSRLPYERGCFDGVFGSLIEPSFSPDSLSEIRRVCKPGGWFGFTVPAGEWALALRKSFSNLHRTSFALGSGRMVEVGSPCLTAATIYECLEKAGFLDIQITTNAIGASDAIHAPPAVKNAYSAIEKDATTFPITHCILATRE